MAPQSEIKPRRYPVRRALRKALRAPVIALRKWLRARVRVARKWLRGERQADGRP